MSRHLRPLTCLLSLVLLAGVSDVALAKSRQLAHVKKSHASSARHHHAAHKKDKHARREAARKPSKPAKPAGDVAAEAVASLPPELAAVRQVLELARKGKTAEATAACRALPDPAAQKLAEWYILRHPEADTGFARYAAFLAENPDWPSRTLMRRRAEARLWKERKDAAIVRQFTAGSPLSAKGRLALARVLLAEGDRDGAAQQVRTAYRAEELTDATESEVIEQFGDLLTREDHRARMDKRIGAKDLGAAMRAARRVGEDAIAIVKACAAGDAKKGLDLLDGVATDARADLGYALCRAKWMMRHDRTADAVQVILSAAPETMAQQDTDEWWRVRRVLARKLLDQRQFEAAYRVAANAAAPANVNYRAESHFLPGWIALRYLHDAKKARAHFAHIDAGCSNPIVIARANYWRGRAAESLGEREAARNFYQAAARHPTAYYGQLARARLALEGSAPRQVQPDPASKPSPELVRAAETLYALGERDLARIFVVDLAEQSNDIATLAAIGELTRQHNDAHAMLELGKAALSRGLALEQLAFPTIGIPQHTPVGPAIERSIIYSVARTESGFDQKDRSPANAVGLMQVTPEAGRDTARRFGVPYDWDRMVSDPVYNTQMGAAELGALLQEYRGSYIMTFAGYNAGRGRVRDWVKAYGDPRDPNVDAVDWVERIPFAETRNYVQRVMENLLVYRARFEAEEPVTASRDRLAPSAGSTEASAAP